VTETKSTKTVTTTNSERVRTDMAALWQTAGAVGTRSYGGSVSTFLDLHRSRGFVIPNVWDAGSARILEQVGFGALATTSAGIAFSHGVPDGSLDRDEMLAAVGRIVAAVGCPVSADLESGYGHTPEDVGGTVSRAAALGAMGANIEDAESGRLFGIDEASDRLAAARAAAPTPFVLNARTDTYLVGADSDRFAETVERARRYVEAGADCVFVPGVDDRETIRRLAEAVPAPLNVVAGLTSTVLDAPTLFGLGVRRVSVGGSLARAALGFVERAGREMLEDGTFGFTATSIAHGDLQRRFAPATTRLP
jgi:2-methylisocitrate lyase-like PEP mutase family enzyme